MADITAPVLTFAGRHNGAAGDPLARAAASGRSMVDASRLFEVLTAGADFGGLDALVEDLARARLADHLAGNRWAETAVRIFEALPESERAAFVALSTSWGARMACAMEVGFHAGFAAGRAK